jgi:hypothetical protein
MLPLLLQDLILQQPELLYHNFIVIVNGMKALMLKPTNISFAKGNPQDSMKTWIALVLSMKPRNKLIS